MIEAPCRLSTVDNTMMNSNLPIPGLGQLEYNNTQPTSNPATEDARAPANAETTPDTGTARAEDLQRDIDVAGIEKETEATAQAETDATEAPESQARDAADLRHADIVVNGEGFKDVNMQDTLMQDTSRATQDNVAMATSGAQDTEMLGSESRAQKASDEKSSPASPRVTDALEAALDGLLGPTEEVDTKDAAATDAEQGGQQVLKDPIHKDPVPTPELQPTSDVLFAEGEADANPEWEVDSSPYESPSSDSSDDSSDNESDVEESKLGIEETARLLMEADGGSDDEMDGMRAAKQAAGVRTKNEQPDEPEPKPDIKIEPDETILPLGIVQHIVEGTQVVIEALRDGTAVTILDRGTALCKEDRTILGAVHDTIATVHKPMYILKFRNEDEVKEAGLERGTQIWYPKSLANFVFPSQLRQEKGSDASNLHDEEVGPEEMEYSDDEQEQAHKREKKNRKRGKGKFNKGEDNDRRGPAANASANLRYDEDDDGPYKPLSRPANFGMGLPAPPPPGVSAFPPANGSRGGHHQGRRGDSRGRVGRGRGFNGRGRGGHGHNNHQVTPEPQNYQPPPPFPTNPPPVPGQWPFPIPPIPQFSGAAPPHPGAPSSSYLMQSWGATQSAPFPFPPVPPVSNWANPAQRPPQQASYSPPTGGYSMPVPYPPNGAANASTPAPSSYQYPNYYGGGQAQNGQPQQHRWE